MNRFFQLLLALVALLAGSWLLYAGYGRGVSLAGRTSTGLAQLKTAIDGRTRVPLHYWQCAGGGALILGGMWWLVKGGRPRRRRR